MTSQPLSPRPSLVRSIDDPVAGRTGIARPRVSSRGVAAAVVVVATATIAGALASQHLFGLVPCKLCLQQRWPYYLGVPLAVATLLAPSGRLRGAGFAVLALVFAVGAGLGTYHAGAEWGWWAGPSDCGGGLAAVASPLDMLRSLETVRIVSCTEAAWRFAGLSLAGWNAVVSAGLAAFSAYGARSAARGA